MAAMVEEPAGPAMEQLETDDMKNTARKSTTKPAQLTEKVSSSSPSPVANGNVESPGDKHCVTNGNGTHKRSVADQEDAGNPAKIARLHIEEMEKAQEEMTRKVSREEDNNTTEVAQNGEVLGEDSSHSQGDKSNDSNNSKQSSLSQHSRSSLALSADARNTFKGILDSAMAKVGPQRNSINGQEPSANDCKSSSVPSEDKPDQSMDVDKTQQENGDSKQDVNSSQPDDETSDLKPVDISSDSQDVEEGGTSEETKSKDVTSAEKETEQVVSESNDAKEVTKDNSVALNDTEEVISKDDDVAKATSKDDDVVKATSTDDGAVKDTSTDNDVAKTTSKDSDVAKATSKATSKDNDVTKATSDSHALNDDALLEEGDTEDHAGDVDDAVLLSDDDKCDDKSPSKDKVTKESGNKPDETQGDKTVDKSSDDKSKDEADSDKCTGSSEQSSKEAPDVEASPSVADKEKDKTEKDTETSQSEGDKDNASKESSIEKETSEDTEEQPTSETNNEASTESSESKAKKAKGFDIPEDKIISLSDDEGEEEKAQSDSKSETKIDLNPDDPIEIEDEDDEEADDDDDKKSDVSDLSQRKRGATSPIPSESSSTTKKSRLDKVIGRLGSAVNKKADDDAPIDVDEIGDKEDEKAAESTEEKMDVDKVVIKDVTNEGDNDIKKDSNTDTKDDVKPDIKPEVSKTPSLCVGKKNITLTAEELNELLIKRMNAYLERSKGSLVVQLQTRIGELQQAVESWRAQAKRLAKQLDEEVAKSSQRRQGKMIKQTRPTQLQASAMQQQAGGGAKVTIRGTPPRPTPQGIPTNVNAVPMRLSPAQVAAAQAKGTTVRDLLDKQRLNDPVGSKSSQSVQIQGGRILVSGAQIGVRNGSLVSAGGPRPGTVVRTVHPPGTSPGGVGKSVIDLTDDDGGTGNTPPKIVRTAAGQQVAVRAMGPAGSSAGRPGTMLVQQVPSTGGGPVLVQQVASSQQIRTAGGTTFVYTSRPGANLPSQTAPGTSLVRPASAAPPTLRPAATQLVTLSRAGPTTNTITRPPPPLRSAPTVNNTVNNTQAKHPAPLPPIPDTQPTHPKRPPPKPGLKISRVQSGIVLSWNMAVLETAAQISSYQLFAYQETSAAPATSLWKKVGDVKALPLPMACTLTQFQEGNKYHFAVRAVDVHNRVGPFSEPSSIALTAISIS